jgi:hypothetical protein
MLSSGSAGNGNESVTTTLLYLDADDGTTWFWNGQDWDRLLTDTAYTVFSDPVLQSAAAVMNDPMTYVDWFAGSAALGMGGLLLAGGPAFKFLDASATTNQGAPSLRPLQGWEPPTYQLEGLRSVLPTLSHRTAGWPTPAGTIRGGWPRLSISLTLSDCGCPILSRFVRKGGRHRLRLRFRTGDRVSVRGSHPCKKRKSGAPSVVVESKGWATRPLFGPGSGRPHRLYAH